VKYNGLEIKWFYSLWVDPVDKFKRKTYKHGIQHEILQNAQVLKLVGIELTEDDLEIKLFVSPHHIDEAEKIWDKRAPRVIFPLHKFFFRQEISCLIPYPSLISTTLLYCCQDS